MAAEQEFHAHKGQPAERSNGRFYIPDDDTAPHVSQYEQQAPWSIEVYDERRTRLLAQVGGKRLVSTHSAGAVFAVDAQQLDARRSCAPLQDDSGHCYYTSSAKSRLASVQPGAMIESRLFVYSRRVLWIPKNLPFLWRSLCSLSSVLRLLPYTG